MARGQSLIVGGGGIQAGTPFDIGSLPRIVQTTPPTVADSIAFQRTQGGVEVLTVGLDTGLDWPLSALFSERLQTVGGFISDNGPDFGNFLAGEGAAGPLALNTRNVIIGRNARADASTLGIEANVTNNVVVGAGANTTAGLGSLVVIGSNATYGGASIGAGVLIGADSVVAAGGFTGVGIGVALTLSGGGVLIGNSAHSSTVNNFVAVGNLTDANAQGQTVLGDGAQGNGGDTHAIVIGRNASSRGANTLTIGGINVGVFDILIGEGPLSGGAAPDVLWGYSGSQGTDIPGGDIIYTASNGTGAAATKGSHIFQSGTPGVSSFFGQTIAPRLAIRTAGPGFGESVDFLGVTTAAGALGGTLLNAPTAGDPAFWLPILIGGVLHKIPCWL